MVNTLDGSLGAAGALDGANLLWLEQSGLPTKVTLTTLAAYVGGVPVSTQASSVLIGDGAAGWVEETNATISATGAITALSYGGILEANLISRIVDETVSGQYTFSHASGILIGAAPLTATLIGAWNTAEGWGDWAGNVKAGDVNAEASTDGWVLTSQGGGVAAWEAAGGVGDAVLANANVFTYARSGAASGLKLASANPFLIWDETDAATDEGGWLLGSAGGDFYLRSMDDAGGNLTDIMQVNRAGDTVSEVVFGVNIQGLANIEIVNAAPKLLMIETGVTAHAGRWDFVAEAEQMHFRIRGDADVGGADWLTVDRTTTTVDSVNLLGTAATVAGTLAVTSNLSAAQITSSSTGSQFSMFDTDDGDSSKNLLERNGSACNLYYYTGSEWELGWKVQDDAAFKAYYNGNEKFSTAAGGAGVTGAFTATTTVGVPRVIGSSDLLKLGAADDYLAIEDQTTIFCETTVGADTLHYASVMRGGMRNDNTSTRTGYFRIEFPDGSLTASRMMSIEVHGYNYAVHANSDGGPWGIVIGGYPYNTENWNNADVHVLYGTPPFDQVMLGEATSNKYILLGTATTQWDYPQVMLRNYMAGYSNQNISNGLWTLDINASVPTGWSADVTDGTFNVGGQVRWSRDTSGMNLGGNMTISESAATGGANGDIHYKY